MRILRKIFKITLFFIILGMLGIVSLYVIAYFQPNISLNTANSYYIYDINDNLINMGSKNGTWVSLDEIDSNYLNYIIATEDQYFYYHKGFDFLRIIKSMFNNIKEGNIVEGASSISQQYVKNLFLEFDKTWERKIKEAFLTMRLETHYSKNEILEGYLNTIYFGNGIYGIHDATKYYFNKEPGLLTIEESIVLAGIPKSPNKYNPINNIDKCLNRANLIAKLLLDKNIISDNEYNSLDFNNLTIYGKYNDNDLNTLMYYKDAIDKELNSIDSIPKDLINTGGLRIFTNLDLDLQSKLEENINNYTNEDNTQIASIIMDPKTGKVLALAGGKDFNKSEFNRALNAKRQVGSTIKPFLYYAALQAGMTESSTFKSENTTFVFAENKTYSPTNYAEIYANKEISMAAALAFSDNIYAVKTHLFLGESTLVNVLKECGLKTKVAANPSLALGAEEITMIDYIGAYATLASGGYEVEPYFINKIEDINGNVLYQKEEKHELVLDQSSVYIVNEMMRNTYNYDFIDYTSPTILYLNGRLSKNYAIKSGTTDNDYWIMGYNNDVIMAVWAGNDDNTTVDKKYSRNIKDIWAETVEYYESDKEDTWYNLPDNVIAIPADPISGKYDQKSKTLFYYIKGTENAYIN